MSSWKLSLVVGVVSALVTAGSLYFYGGLKVKEMSALNAANQKLRMEILARSDARKTLPKERAEAATPSAEAGAAAVETPTPVALPAIYRNEGQVTPVATLQTFAWACDRGDTAKVAKLLTFEGSGRTKVAALMAKLPEKVRSECGTPEELAATICISGFMQRPYPAATIIALAETESTGPDRMRIRLPGTSLDGGSYLKTEAGWKFVIPEAGIDDHIARNFGKMLSAP